jgi:8-oxo-dGTP pyrophosphatase MutT (NUDIX family)
MGRLVPGDGVMAALDRFEPRSADEAGALARARALARGGDPWSRSSPLHVTGSAIVVHPQSGRVLLRWHERMQGWLQLGGHGDPGETDPFAVALREAGEETGLSDLVSWPDRARPALVHVVVVPVPAGRGEPEHEHADMRYVLATARPDDATPESPAAALRWLTIDDALALVGEDNLRTTLVRVAQLLAGARGSCGAPPSPYDLPSCRPTDA